MSFSFCSTSPVALAQQPRRRGRGARSGRTTAGQWRGTARTVEQSRLLSCARLRTAEPRREQRERMNKTSGRAQRHMFAAPVDGPMMDVVLRRRLLQRQRRSQQQGS